MKLSDTVERQTLIRAPRSKVWRALTTSAHFSKWFGVETADEFRAGATVRMKSTSPDHPGEFFVVIDEMTPETRFVWRWRVSAFPDPGLDEPFTRVVFDLEEVEGGTLVKVAESGFDGISAARRAKAYRDNEQGWEHQMGSIRNYVEQTS